MREHQRRHRAVVELPRHARVVECLPLSPGRLRLAARLAKRQRLGEVDRAQVGPGRRDRVGMRLHPHCLAAKQPAQGVIGVRADVGDAAGRRQAGIIAPREWHVVRAWIVPAIDHAANVAQQAGLKHLAGSHERLAVTRPKRHVVHQPGIAVGGPHLVGLVDIHADRFFAEQMFTGIGTSHHGLVMQCVRRGDDNEIHIRMLHNLTPVIGQQLGTVLLPCPIKQFTPASTQRNNVCTGSLADLRTVRCADVAGGPNHADVELKLTRWGFVVRIHAVLIVSSPGRFNHKLPWRNTSMMAALSASPNPNASAFSSRFWCTSVNGVWAPVFEAKRRIKQTSFRC